jgi:hypothetical protein
LKQSNKTNEGSKLVLWAQISLKGIGVIMQEEFEDTKDVFRIRISKKNRQHKCFPLMIRVLDIDTVLMIRVLDIDTVLMIRVLDIDTVQ